MRKYFFIALIALLPFFELAAQGNSNYGRGQGRGPRDGPGPPPAVPIDGGLIALLAAGGLFGAKKLKDHFKEEE